MSRSGRFDSIIKEALHFIPQMTAVANAISNPRNIGFAQKIQVGPSPLGGFLDPRRTAAEVVRAIHDRTEQVGVLD